MAAAFLVMKTNIASKLKINVAWNISKHLRLKYSENAHYYYIAIKK